MSASHLRFRPAGGQCKVSAPAGATWTVGVAARQTKLVIGGCTYPLADEEEAMSTAEPLGEEQWPTTGVDLETRRLRILATLTALGRPSEVEQFPTGLGCRDESGGRYPGLRRAGRRCAGLVPARAGPADHARLGGPLGGPAPG